MRFFLYCFFCLSTIQTFSQTSFSGKVIDENQQPISFAHIKITNTQKGTISNEEGIFRIVLNDNSKRDITIIISAIGYEFKKISLKKNQYTQIILEEASTLLSPITVTSVDYARQLIKKAIKKIPENYPLQKELHIGFNRELLFLNKRELPKYIIESTTEAAKEPYDKQSKGKGMVRLSEIRRYRSSSMDSILVRFFGGLHSMHTLDAIAKKFMFLDTPEKFEFDIKDTLKYDNKAVFQVSFQKIEDKDYSGYIYIVDSTFAISQIERSDDSPSRSLFGRDRKYSRYIVSYEQSDDKKWRLKNCTYTTAFSLKGDLIELKSNYVTTEIRKVEQNIPYNERFQYGDVPLDVDKPYNPKFWENYTIISPDESIEGLFRSQERMSQGTANSNSDKTSITKFFDILYKIKIGYSVTWSRLTPQLDGIFYSNPAFTINQQESLSSKAFYGFNSYLLYKFKPNTFFGFVSESSISRNGASSFDFVLFKSFNINPKGRPINLSPMLKLGYQSFRYFYGNYESAEQPFEIRRKTFDSGSTNVFLAQNNIRVEPNLLLSIEKSNRLDFFATLGYNLPLSSQKGILFIEDNEFFLFRKRQFLENGSEGLAINIDGDNLLQNNLNISFGILYGF